MSISTAKQVAIGATFLALSTTAKSAPILVSSTASIGKGSLGIDHVSLDEMPGRALTICANEADKFDTNLIANDITVVLDPFSTSKMELVFMVSDIPASNQDHILFLVYSTGLSPSPQIVTPRSIRKLELDLTRVEMAAVYNIPKQIMIAQDSTRIGVANPAPMSKVMFKVNLDTAKIPVLMNSGEPTIYAQAALIRKVDFDNGMFNNMILSEADKITFATTMTACDSKDTKITEENSSLTISGPKGVVDLMKPKSTSGVSLLGKTP